MNSPELLISTTESYLKGIIVDAAEIPESRADLFTSFGELGIDSFRVLKIIKRLEQDFGPLPKTLLFEHYTIASLAAYFADEKKDELHKITKGGLNSSNAKDIDNVDTEIKQNKQTLAVDRKKIDSYAGPILMAERDIEAYPSLAKIVKDLFEKYKNEGGVSRGTRSIAPNLFIGRSRKGYFHYCRSNRLILVYSYTGPMDYLAEIAEELLEHCDRSNLKLYMFSGQPIDNVGAAEFTSNQFGVVQRIDDIASFNLEGKKMRRLRYLVSKFEKAGDAKTCEYICGSNTETDQAIAETIDRWCADRTMVNPLVHVLKDEILAGKVTGDHRLFLTYLDSKLENVILVTPLADNGYLMDLEFYSREMPLGGLEYAIANILSTLAAEGQTLFSLGGTYGCRLEDVETTNPDQSIEKILAELHSQNIFNDEGNLQFKNKFRPTNSPIYICRKKGSGESGDLIDIIMMIADPHRMQTSDEEHFTNFSEPVTDKKYLNFTNSSIDPQKNGEKSSKASDNLQKSNALENENFNALNVSYSDIAIDLRTDSWAHQHATHVAQRMSVLRENLQNAPDVHRALKAIFPFEHITITGSCRLAEKCFFRAFPKKGVVLQNPLFPTTIFHQIDNGFSPVEIPTAQALNSTSVFHFKAGLDIDSLQRWLDDKCSEVAMVYVELANNALGGQPLSLAQLREIKNITREHQLPLVVDATRVLENADFISKYELSSDADDVLSISQEIFAEADVVLASLAKDFGIGLGGIVATRDFTLHQRIKAIVDEEGSGVDVIDKKLIALALSGKKYFCQASKARIAHIEKLHSSLQELSVPVIQPAGGHCVVIDPKQIAPFADFECPAASFVAWVYSNTGILGGIHNAGLHIISALKETVRFAIPIGSSDEHINEIIQQFSLLMREKTNIPELRPLPRIIKTDAEYGQEYELVKLHNPSTSNANEQPLLSLIADSQNIQIESLLSELNSETQTGQLKESQQNSQSQLNEIAIVGVAGRYPKARNIDDLWRNLVEGVDCIEEIPAARLMMRQQIRPQAAYRGGFIADVDRFDSLFFGISPREAETMDPQERHFMEVAWETIEDAGYCPDQLESEQGGRVGVFVGAVWTLYQMAGSETRLQHEDVVSSSFLWSIANRISYFLNLTGPSLAVDTACSSSLTALHMACESLRRGDCSTALVGGVNLDTHEFKFDMTKAGGALSPDGVCRSFGKGANGYVAGEGIGAILLKPLDQAIADKDNIYGIIKGSAINHGGKTSGYSVPNPQAQGTLIAQAIKNAGIDSNTIGYIEAHGTGTALGDPVEVSGLTKAFGKSTQGQSSVAVGSVKTNIGHLEAAAGIAGVTKVLLQMKHKQLVPSLHSEELNELIDFSESPLKIQQTLQGWQPKPGAENVLRAGISSFGAGGANAHVILESFNTKTNLISGGSQQIIPLSARSEQQVLQIARALHAKLTSEPSTCLENVALTLQLGRKSFEFRTVLVANSTEVLIDKLDKLINGIKDEAILSGQAHNSDALTRYLDQREKSELVNLLSQRSDQKRFARLWIDGVFDDWSPFRSRLEGSRISLPTYPFADKRHWINKPATKQLGVSSQHFSNIEALHPLIDSNESTFERQVFCKHFSEQDFVIHDHLVSNIPTLPGVAYLELARKAGELAAGHQVRKIRNILWVSPLMVQPGGTTETFVELIPTGDSVAFEVFGHHEEKGKTLFSQGKLFYATPEEAATEPEYLDIETIKSRCIKVTTGRESYPLFKSLGLDLGSGFQVVANVYRNETEVLGELILPVHRHSDLSSMVLHPGLMDGAFQAAMAARIGDKVGEMFVPYSIGEIEILAPLEEHCFTYVVAAKDPNRAKSKVSRMNVFVVNAQGRILVKVKDSVGVPLVDIHEKPKQSNQNDSEFETLYYAPEWKQAALPEKISSACNTILFFDIDDQRLQHLLTKTGDTSETQKNIILVLPGESFSRACEQIFTVNPERPEDFRQLLESLLESGFNISDILFGWPNKYLSDETQALSLTFVETSLPLGVYSLLYLCKALGERKLDQKIHLLCFYREHKNTPEPHNQAMSAFLRSVNIEYSKIESKVVAMEAAISDAELATKVFSEISHWNTGEHQVRYNSGVRYLSQLSLVSGLTKVADNQLPFKHKGVYLIAGGVGGLGYLFAQHLADRCAARLILLGRSALSKNVEEKLSVLRDKGAEVFYEALDIADPVAIADLMKKVNTQFGALNGVIHSAGVLRDAYLKNKTADELRDVFSAKVFGTLVLDSATQKEPLDFFVTFSSLAGIGGNAGQSDYAFANQFMDAFAARRQIQVETNRRSGKSLSINWSLWTDGGMKMDEQSEMFFRKNLGIKALDSTVGMKALELALCYEGTQLAVLEAVQHKIERAWGINQADTIDLVSTGMPTESSFDTNQITGDIPQTASGGDEKLTEMVRGNLVKIAAEFLKMQPEEVALGTILLELGFDSIGLTTYANAINNCYSTDVTPVLFFEYPSIREITSYLVLDEEDKVRAFHAVTTASSSTPKPTVVNAEVSPVIKTPESFSTFTNKKAALNHVTSDNSRKPVTHYGVGDIAIVGISGVMPNAQDMNVFWKNLEQGTSMISEIPRDRWRWEDYFGDPKTQTNRTDCKWGGFMPEVDKFDADFFGISAREAQSMDPQQRLLLEAAWKAVEDSGHKIADLAGSKTGVFVGVGTHDYTELMASHNVTVDGYISTGNSHAVLVNRISYVLGLHGPSAAIDTACSSSLVAMHRAVESIQSGSSEMALVGGVQVMLTPAGFIAFGDAGMLSVDGKVRTFDKDANGYLRGEGVGVIFLKPLSKALEDGNPIYAVIRASAENHGGRATALTAPNPHAQLSLLVDAYTKADIDPASIGYMECHGTATSIGDSIEIQSLKKAFNKVGKRTTASTAPTCGLSSVKSSIGHLEAAAGISALLKALLALKHKKIPASLHFNELNPYIDLRDTPFYIVDKTREWQPALDDSGKPLPRRVGVSSFGFGGSNSHILLEEFTATTNTDVKNNSEIILLSAKNFERLSEYAFILRDHIAENKPSLGNLAYTLRIGRDVMPSRFGCCVNSLDELIDALDGFLINKKINSTVFWSAEKHNRETVQLFNSDSDLKEAIEKWMQSDKKGKLLELWTSGVDIDWSRLPVQSNAKRLNLPTYPFARDRHWFDASESKTGLLESVVRSMSAPASVEVSIASVTWEIGPLVTNKNTMNRVEKMDAFLAQEIANQTGRAADSLDRQANFIELGANSIGIAQFMANTNNLLSAYLSPSILFEFPSILLFSNYLAENFPSAIDAIDVRRIENEATNNSVDARKERSEEIAQKILVEMMSGNQASSNEYDLLTI